MTLSVVALGGNMLLQRGEASIDAQRAHIREAAEAIAGLQDRGTDLVLTHGNGPQVGNLLLQQEQADGPRMPLDVLVAETQAQIGYLLQQELDNHLDDRVASVVTQVLVDSEDDAFDRPTKPVGPFYTESEAAEVPFETAEVRTADGERAYRRVVPSPSPVEVVESDVIRAMVDSGATVIAAGGGGIPVVSEDGRLRGVEAVIDKDRASQVLAGDVNADELLVLTDVDYAYLDYGDPDQRPIETADPEQLREYLSQGEFAEGSMRPKIESCAKFVENGGRRAVITSPDRLSDALDGTSGTRVLPAGEV